MEAIGPVEKEWLARFRTVQWMVGDTPHKIGIGKDQATRYISAHLETVDDYKAVWATWRKHVSATKPGDKHVTESWDLCGGVFLANIIADATTSSVVKLLAASITRIESLRDLLRITDGTTRKAQHNLMARLMEVEYMRDLTRAAILSSATTVQTILVEK